MDAEQIAAIAGPALIVAGLLVLALVALRPPAADDDDGTVPLVLADPDDDVHPGLDDPTERRLPVGAERVLASLTEVTPDPRNHRAITTTHRGPSRTSTPAGDPDTGVIRILDRADVQRPVPPDAVGRHPATPTGR